MNEHDALPEPTRRLIDDYLDGLLDEAGTRALEELLCGDAALRSYFARYAHLHTELHLEARAQEATERVIRQIEPAVAERSGPTRHVLEKGWARWLALAACLVVSVGLGGWLVAWRDGAAARGEPAIAWLVNAQNCQWGQGAGPVGDLQGGSILRLDRGLVEIRFQCGAHVVLEGPASLELISSRSARLAKGKLTARVPSSTTGFEILSSQGKVIDLGTEFGMSVSDTGATNVYVFEGKVEARATDSAKAKTVSLTQNQSARIANGQVTLQEQAGKGKEEFIRAIIPPPIVLPRIFRLTFDRSHPGSIRGADGTGTGLTHRLPGTGDLLHEWDSNLRLDTDARQLELTTTNSDVNTQYQLKHGEYLGARLSDLGFTGKEDFSVTATFPDIPALEFVGQFGLYAGVGSNRNVRGGVIGRRETGQYTQFFVNNKDGKDTPPNMVGLLSTGTSLRLTLSRLRGEYSLMVENLTSGGSSTLAAIRHPTFLDEEKDLYVGLFGANTQSEVRKTLTIKEFAVTVWTTASP